MAKQKFSAVQREALWLAHNKKCAYTRGLLDISSFHIDHVIPENLAEEPIALEEVIAQLGLDSNFNLHGYENLLPCQPGTNLHKNSLLLDPAPLHFFLNIASSKKAEVEANLVQIEKRQDANRALILLQQCLESGKLSALEVAKILEENIEQPEVVFRLIERMQFSDIDVQSITKLDIEEFRDRPIKLGLNDHIST